MAPGPKKRSFHTPRNTKNAVVSKNNEKKVIESNNEVNKSVDVESNVSTDSSECNLSTNQRDKYSKRTVENNWNKYEEPIIDPHADKLRGRDFNVLLSYSGGSGSQLKLQDEKEWEDEFMKEISLDVPDLISAMKCIPFHERIGLQNILDETIIMNFIEKAKKCASSYEFKTTKTRLAESMELEETPSDAVLNIMESDSDESDDIVLVKNITVQDKTENIINTLTSNLSFKTFAEEEKNEEKESETKASEEKRPETNDLDFLLSLNISSKVSAKEENTAAPKSANVDDWLNSILDD